MEISPSSGIAFSGLWSAYKARKEAKRLRKMAQKAAKMLQTRLVDKDTLMINKESGLIYKKETGEKFSGKFVVLGGALERIYRIKEGAVVSSLVRLKNGLKLWAVKAIDKGFRSKNLNLAISFSDKKMEIRELNFAENQVFENMVKRFTLREKIN